MNTILQWKQILFFFFLFYFHGMVSKTIFKKSSSATQILSVKPRILNLTDTAKIIKFMKGGETKYLTIRWVSDDLQNTHAPPLLFAQVC